MSTQHKPPRSSTSAFKKTKPYETLTNQDDFQNDEDWKLQKRIQLLRKRNSASRSIAYRTIRRRSMITDQFLRCGKIGKSDQSYRGRDGIPVQLFIESTMEGLSTLESSLIASLNQSKSKSSMNSQDINSITLQQRKKKQLLNTITDFDLLFIQYIFFHYYQLTATVGVILRQQLEENMQFEKLLADGDTNKQKVQDSANKQFLEDEDRKSSDSDKQGLSNQSFEDSPLEKEDILYPPPYDVKDFVYISDKNYFKLPSLNQRNPYQQRKANELIFLKLGIIDLVQFARILIKIFSFGSSQEKYSKQNIPLIIIKLLSVESREKFKQFLQEINYYDHDSNKTENTLDVTFMDYESRAFLLQVGLAINEQITKTKAEKFINLQNPSIHNQFNQFVRQICQQTLIRMMEWVSFYNFIICCYEYFNKESIPIKNYVTSSILSSLNQPNSKLRHDKRAQKKINKNVELTTQAQEQSLSSMLSQQRSSINQKIELFIQTYKNPQLLKRIFREAIAPCQHKHHFLSRLEQPEFNMYRFYSNLWQIPEIQNLIKNLSRYQTHYLQYSLEIISDLASDDNIFLEMTFNVVRIILVVLVSIIAKLSVRRIEREIYYCYEPFISNRLKQVSNKNARLAEAQKRIDKSFNGGFERMTKYRERKGEKSSNAAKYQQLQKKLPQMIELIETFYKNQKNNESITQKTENEQISIAFKYTIQLLAKQYLSKRILQRFFLKFSKEILHSSELNFQSFRSNKPIEQRKSKIEDTFKFEQCMDKFERMHKIALISMLKVYSIVSTLWCYSWTIEQLNQRRKIDKKKQQPKDEKEMMSYLDSLYIQFNSRIDTKYLKAQNDKTLTEILKKFTNYTCLINIFFQKLHQQNNLSTVLYPKNEIKRHCVIPVCKKTIRQFQLENQEEEQDQLTPSKVKLFNLNKIVNRRIQKDKLSIFGKQQSKQLASLIVKQFINHQKSIMNNKTLQGNLRQSYSFVDRQGNVHGLRKEVSSRSISSSRPLNRSDGSFSDRSDNVSQQSQFEFDTNSMENITKEEGKK